MSKLLLAVCLLLPLVSCDRNPAGVADVVVDGRAFVVEPWLGRDFMPGVSPPDGSPLAVYVTLAAADSLQLPQGLLVDRAWVARCFTTWETGMKPDATSPEPWSAVFRGFGGPKWGPDERVDVTVRIILPDGKSTRVRIQRCLIHRSW